MPARSELERRLSQVDGFETPNATREQYATPASIAAHLVHEAGLRGDLDRPVVDLGTGTGVLAIGAALAGAGSITGMDIDRGPLEIARANRDRLEVSVDFVQGGIQHIPLCPSRPVTVLMNPPFGAQPGQRGADRPFLRACADIATVSYSIHNARSRDFIEAYTTDHGGSITHAFAAELSIDRQFAFHEDERRDVPVEVYRIAWD